ncbi:hypothetical protein [Ferrovum sp.]|uniref:hypothetical protein n=1 Tax=Ferrovum sp. TaxID=2609467 RepID=UPI0026066921|nr:hypothetical protein [Ferrovum sp.]
MLDAAMLMSLDEVCTNVLILAEGLEKDEFLSSRLTRAEVKHQILTMTGLAKNISPAIRHRMPELDWSGFEVLSVQIGQSGQAENEALWFSITSLIPATLMWLRVYKKTHPTLFSFQPRAS